MIRWNGSNQTVMKIALPRTENSISVGAGRIKVHCVPWLYNKLEINLISMKILSERKVGYGTGWGEGRREGMKENNHIS